MSLGQVYDLDLKRNESLIKEVVLQAQGEMALEEFVKQVKETWTSYSLDLINYQNKCRLIRGWDDLFNKCGEHLNSLSAMKLSPYYRGESALSNSKSGADSHSVRGRCRFLGGQVEPYTCPVW